MPPLAPGARVLVDDEYAKEADTKLGVRTLPVILGEARARLVGQWLMIAFYPLTILSAVVGLIGAIGTGQYSTPG